MSDALAEVIAGETGDGETGAFLAALRIKGESAGELAAGAAVLRGHMLPLQTGRDDVLDTCGTGGDGSGTFNISTAVAVVAAAAGVPVVKHGNRAVSSHSGSADVMACLGIALDPDPQFAEHCLRETGLAFCFAPHFHPALSRVAALRRRLRFRTVFNLLGPLANPAGAAFQLLGVGHAHWLDPLAQALAQLGTHHAFVVAGQDGLDEVTLGGITSVREVRNHEISSWEWTAADFQLAPCTLEELRADTVEQSASLIRTVLAGRHGPARRIVVANAAAALLAAERVRCLADGVELASATIDDGRAALLLQRLAECSRRAADSA